jgi:hypothetical protein
MVCEDNPQKCTHSAYVRQPSNLVTHYVVRKDRQRDERKSLKRLSGKKRLDTRTEKLNKGNVLIHLLAPLFATAIIVPHAANHTGTSAPTDTTATRRRTSLDAFGTIFISSISLFLERSPQVCILFYFLLQPLPGTASVKESSFTLSL